MNEYLSLASIIYQKNGQGHSMQRSGWCFRKTWVLIYVLMGLASPRARSIPSYPTSPIYVPKTKVRQLVALLYLRDKNVRRISSCPTDFVVKYTISDSTFLNPQTIVLQRCHHTHFQSCDHEAFDQSPNRR